MSRQQNGSAAKTLLVLIFGLGLAVAGFYISKEVKIDFQEKLVEQGIPLDLGKTVSMIGMFIVLFPLLDMFYFKPLSEAIHGRTAELERTFVEAEELRAEMTGLRSDYERRLAETEASAREQIQSQIREAQALRQNLMAEAASKADEMVKKAQQEIEQEKHRVMADLRLAVVDLTLSATEKVLGENVDSDKNRRLVKDFIDKVEVPT